MHIMHWYEMVFCGIFALSQQDVADIERGMNENTDIEWQSERKWTYGENDRSIP